MAEVEQDIIDAGAQIIWVLEQNRIGQPGTAIRCRETMDLLGSTMGWCVGDNQTEPVAGTFDDSPFSVNRGFDIIVPRSTMEIVWSTSHGTPSGNENPSGADVRDAVLQVISEL